MKLASALSQQGLEQLIDREFARLYMKTTDGVVCRRCLSIVVPVKGWLHIHDARAGDGVCLPCYSGDGRQRRPIIREVYVPFCPICELATPVDICCHV